MPGNEADAENSRRKIALQNLKGQGARPKFSHQFVAAIHP